MNRPDASDGETAWSRVSGLFREALDVPLEERPSWLARRCEGEEGLERRVRQLLAAHETLEGDAAFLEGLDPLRARALLGSVHDGPGPGKTVGRYRIEGVLGRGGAGVVYLAHDPGLDRPVALKLLPAARALVPAAADRLLEEARAASALDHPHIGTVYEVGETADGRRFIAMACYEDGTLRERLMEGPLAEDEALALASQVAEALAAAHERGIVHRDLKPENLVFDGRGALKLVDFGLALGHASTSDRSGMRGGTLAYMSPEQRRGEAADARADIYAFGVLLHELLTGHRPDREGGPALPPGTPAPVAALLDRCLARDPADRPASGRALVQALRMSTAAVVAERSWGWRRLAAAALPVGVLVAGAVAIAAARDSPRLVEAEGTAAGTFPERGWVVVADFDATDDVTDLAMATREALAVDLQQSRFVRVVSRAQMAQVLGRMGLSPDAMVDLPLAMELAERFGAGAVLGTTVTRAGNDYVLSGRALDPRTGEELFAVRTASRHDGVLGAVERLSREVRRRLGEDAAALRRSRPLPEVTTRSLEALRLYAEAEQAAIRQDRRAAMLLAGAVEADPGFAMAHRLAAANATSELRFGEAMEHLGKAYEHRDRLPERERWHVEGIHLVNVAFQPRLAAEIYQLLVDRYPEDARAWNNLGVVRQGWLDEHEGAFEAFYRAAMIDSTMAAAVGNVVFAAYEVGQSEVAEAYARHAETVGLDGFALRWEALQAFAEGDVAGMVQACDSLLATDAVMYAGAHDLEVCGSMDVATGRLRTAAERLESVQEAYVAQGRHRNATHVAQALLVADLLAGDSAGARTRITWLLDRLPAEDFPHPDRFITRINLRVQLVLLGFDDLARQVAGTYPPHPEPEHWFARTGEGLVEAARAARAGDGATALATLDAARNHSGHRAIGWAIWDALIRGQAHERLGELDAAARHYAAAVKPGLLVMPPLTKDRIHLPMVLASLARVEEARSNPAGAEAARARLAALQQLAER